MSVKGCNRGIVSKLWLVKHKRSSIRNRKCKQSDYYLKDWSAEQDKPTNGERTVTDEDDGIEFDSRSLKLDKRNRIIRPSHSKSLRFTREECEFVCLKAKSKFSGVHCKQLLEWLRCKQHQGGKISGRHPASITRRVVQEYVPNMFSTVDFHEPNDGKQEVMCCHRNLYDL
mmetsp:Transcript_58459/g.154160  ORF Transcript_58459/g.154160 Transcript_58459/m.154160 type:complete len:171 (+) Transcript_58459:88-600(+)